VRDGLGPTEGETMSRKSTGTYPADWPDIAHRTKAEANGRCIRCGHRHDPEAGRTLTVHHLDMNPSNNRWWNLLAICQACHLSIQGRVYLERPWVMLPHSEWFRPYVAGFCAMFYIGQDLTRDEVMADLEWLLDLQRQVMLIGTSTWNLEYEYERRRNATADHAAAPVADERG
jgi:hypothetical protein